MARTKKVPRKMVGGQAPARALKQFRFKRPSALRTPMRYRPGAAALLKIRRYRRSTELLIKKIPFQRLVRSIGMDFIPWFRFQAHAFLALQEASEAFVIEPFEDTKVCAIHAKRLPNLPQDKIVSL